MFYYSGVFLPTESFCRKTAAVCLLLHCAHADQGTSYALNSVFSAYADIDCYFINLICCNFFKTFFTVLFLLLPLTRCSVSFAQTNTFSL